jgi:dTDP-4-dehydrorhamnose reductase
MLARAKNTRDEHPVVVPAWISKSYTYFAGSMSHHQKNTNHVQTINKVLTHPNYVESLAQQKTNTQNNRGTTQ